MNKFARLFRLSNCIMGVVGLILGSLVASGTSIVDFPLPLSIASVIVFLFVAAGNSLNDYMDREIDKRAHPMRPIPAGLISADRVFAIAGALFGACFVLSFFLNQISILIVVSAIVVMLLYEARLKREGLSGNLSIAWLTAALFLLGGAVVVEVERTLIFAMMAFLATLGREIVKDIEDMESDFNRRTLPMRLGKRKSGIVGSISFATAVALSPVPYFTGAFGVEYLLMVVLADTIFIYCSIIHFQNPKRGQKVAKIGMMVALLAFLVGGLL